MNCIMEWVKKEKINIAWIALSVYSGLSFCYVLNLMCQEILFSFSCLAIPLFLMVLWLIKKTLKRVCAEENKKETLRRGIYSVVLGSMLGMSFVLGYQMTAMKMTLPGYAGKSFIIFISVGLGIGIGSVIYFFYGWLDKTIKVQVSNELIGRTKKLWFWISWGTIFVAWIPAFLAYYPAILSYDCHRQIQEAVSGYARFNSHHPLVHTFLIRMFLMLGEKIGSYETGMAVFSILQMLVLSVIFAYACNMIGRLTKKTWTVVVATAFFALLPIHPVLALSVTKDILFTAFFLLMFLLILEHNQAEGKLKKWLLLAAMLPVGIVMLLFRNNAIYAFAIFAVFYFFWAKKERMMILLLCAAVLLGGKYTAQGIQKGMHAGSGSKVEMFSVFLHQMARVGVKQGENLYIEDYMLIEKYVDDIYWSHYNPTIADGVKNNVAVSTFANWKDDIGGMLKDWFKIGIAYPNDYIDAFLALTSGYWFLDDVSHAEVLGYGERTNMGLLYTFNASESERFEGVESQSVLPGLLGVYKKIVNGNEYYNWPVLNLLFKPAFYCWSLIVIMATLAYKKQKKKWILCLYPLFYLATLLLGPVVNFRYIYPIVAVVPVLFAWLFSNCEWKIKNDKKITNQ